ncbi:MAG: chemotaxis protein CheW [Archangium sp.]|nr:chemotaxis protein CheW [Archangium sp.]
MRDRTTLVERLDALEREAQSLRAQLVSEEAPATGLGLGVVQVRVGTTTACFPLAAVDEVVPMADLTPLPEAPPWIPGVLDRAGVLIPVVDLLARLQRVARQTELDDRIVLTRVEGRRVGFVVQELLGIRQVTGEALQPAPAHSDFARYVTGLVPLEDGHSPLLSPTLLLFVSQVPSLPASEGR